MDLTRYLSLMTNYTFWKLRMESYFNSMGFEIWNSGKYGYTFPSTPPTIVNEIRLYENNGKERNAIISELTDSKLVKMMHYKTKMFGRSLEASMKEKIK